MMQIKDIIRRFGTVPMKTYPFSAIYRHKIYLRYLRRVKVVKPLNMMPYHKAEALALLEEIRDSLGRLEGRLGGVERRG